MIYDTVSIEGSAWTGQGTKSSSFNAVSGPRRGGHAYAVVNFVLTEKYGQDPELAASIVALSTLVSVATIPMVLWLIL